MRSSAIAAAIVATGIMFSNVGSAQIIDMTKFTCKDFLSDMERIPNIVMWVNGYINGQLGTNLMRENRIKKMSVQLGKFCAKNEEKPLIEAIDSLDDEIH